MICTLVRFHIKHGCGDRFLELARTSVEQTRLEKGNISYDMGPELGKTDTFIFFERWKNQESVIFMSRRPIFSPLTEQQLN